MLKLFKKRYVNYDDIYEDLNKRWEYYHDLALQCLDIARNARKDGDERRRKYYLNKAEEYNHKSMAILDFRTELYKKYGRV